MKHRHCHCDLKAQLKKFRAGKLGIFGGVLIIGHLLFHVVECLALPAILMALRGSSAEAATSEISDEELVETTLAQKCFGPEELVINFSESLEKYQISQTNW